MEKQEASTGGSAIGLDIENMKTSMWPAAIFITSEAGNDFQ